MSECKRCAETAARWQALRDPAQECEHAIWETVRLRDTAGGEAIFQVCEKCGKQMTEPA